MWQLTSDRRGFRLNLFKIWPKQLTLFFFRTFGVEFHKMGDGFSTVELCQVPSCGRNRQVFYIRPKFAQKGILGSNFIKLVTDSS